MSVSDLRNVAIIAHVDHGKTTLVDQMLRQSGLFRDAELDKLAGGQHGLIFDSNPLERERGITILSKNCAVTYARPGAGPAGLFRINIIDTPGHADFGGEVERVMRMADGCLLLVDSFDGPMPQTRFVLTKALESGLRPIVVVNKCDREDGRPDEVVNEVFDLLVELGADDKALDFPVIFASARAGWATHNLAQETSDLRDLFETIIEHVPPAAGDPDAPLQMLITSLDSSDYVGRIGIGRVFAGRIRKGQSIAVMKRTGGRTQAKVVGLQRFAGLGRIDAEEVAAGDLCAVVGVEGVDIGDTLADTTNPVALATVSVDEPTLTMLFRINDSPFVGQEGDLVTSRQIRARLEKELERNVALRVETGVTADEFVVSGRGLLHLGILLETMRREGFELSVGKPEVIIKMIDGAPHEPLERLTVTCPDWSVGAVMEHVGARRGELKHMEQRSSTARLEFEAPARGLIGLRSRLLTATQGEAIMHHTFDRYVPSTGEMAGRQNGVMTATEPGQVTAYAIENFSDRGVMFVEPRDRVYAGQIVGEHNRDSDLPVNIVREKKLTNMRAASKDATVTLKAPRKMSLEAALEYIERDELVELTPKSIRLRKRILDESARRRAERSERAQAASV
ncbi:MAG: translational GTPase TypA [Phycisphaeraceae bacterium]|nr:MAG: translational GTPase TypA [Phycisphaeraceae bacterium]